MGGRVSGGAARVLAAVALTAAAAACGGGGPPEQVVLDVLMADDWAGTDAVLDVVRGFEADNPGVRVDLVGRPFSQILDDVAAAAAAGQPVDVAHHHAFAAGAIGLAEPLDDRWSDGTFDAAAHVEGAMADVTWGSTRYGVPLDVNALMLLRAPGVPAPATFADVRRVAERAAAAEGAPAMTLSANAWEAYGWIRANGGEVVDVAADGSPSFTLDAPANVEALAFLGDLVADGLAYGPLTRDVSTDATDLFRAGDTALLTTGTWVIADLEARAHPHAAGRMPSGGDVGDPGTALGGSSLFVGRGSDQVDLSVAFVQALTADDVAVRLALEEGRFPPRPALYERLGAAPGAEPLADALPSAHPMLLIAFPSADAAFADAIDAVLTGRADAATALSLAQSTAEASLAGS